MHSGSYHAAGYALDELLGGFGIRLAKRLDPLDADDFLVISARLARAMRGVAEPAEAKALRVAINALDVDWPSLTDAGRDRVIAAAKGALKAPAETVLPKIDVTLESAGTSVMEDARKATIERYDFSISADLQALDKKAAKFLRQSEVLFIRDQYGNRADVFDARARKLVAAGMERGLGRADISERLSDVMGRSQIARSENYWNLIATTFVNRARTATQLSAYDDAGVTTYQFSAVLDEHTTEICRFMDGQTFRVSDAVDRLEASEKLKDPEDIKAYQPWVQNGRDKKGNDVLYYTDGDRRRVVAQVDRFGEGVKDRIGSYSREMSGKQLGDAGIMWPPLHGHCRSTIVTFEG
jgi:SPP1 gp7 family putative phage head morphogenesis protein